MVISYSRGFEKMFRKLSTRFQNQFEERIILFVNNPYHPLLYNHSLNGAWIACRSINITGDLRAVYEEISVEHIEFVAIGSHSELYS